MVNCSNVIDVKLELLNNFHDIVFVKFLIIINISLGENGQMPILDKISSVLPSFSN